MRGLIVPATLFLLAQPAPAQEPAGGVVCDGAYPLHLQGVARDAAGALYWSYTDALVKTDARGRVLAKVPVANHHGDLTHVDGRLYVAVNLGEFNQPEGEADSWVYVYSSADLAFVARHPVPEVVHGAGGIGHHEGRFVVVGGLPAGVDVNYLYEYDAAFELQRRHVLASGYTELGIQTATHADGRWWFGCYGEPRVLLVADAAFEFLGRQELDCAYGIVSAPNGRLLLARDSAVPGLGHVGRVVVATPEAARPALAVQPPDPIRVGMIGLDTSHVTAFAKILNDPDAAEDVANCSVVAAYPPGSDLAFALERRVRYTAELEALGVEMVASIDELLARVDAVMLMTVDGRPHLEQARPVLASGKPMFIDKPLAGTLADAVELLRLADELSAPVFTSSSLRYAAGAAAARAGAVGDVLGADAYSPCSLEPHHPDLFWYGVHGVELLYTAMGPGCESVVRTQTEDTELVVGTWSDGRVGTFRGIRAGKTGYGGTVFGSTGIGALGPYEGYRPLVVEIVRFFRTRESPVDPAESLEIFTFMEAADESKRRGGIAVSLAGVLEKAESEEQR